MFAGISCEGSRGPLGSSFDASRGPFWGFLGPLLELFWSSWRHLGASDGVSRQLPGGFWGSLEVSWGPVGAEGSNFRVVVPLLGCSWDRLGALLGCLGRLMDSLGTSRAVLGTFWADLGRSWGLLGPSWSVGKPKRRHCWKH
eukprot:8494402-Pyramimonas_sp.AAC.1